MKKSGGETFQSDEHRKFANSPPPLPTDRVSPSFDPHPLRRSERIHQKNKVNTLDGVNHKVRFAKEVTIFHFDPDDVVKCNYVFPDRRRQQHREEGGGVRGGLLLLLLFGAAAAAHLGKLNYILQHHPDQNGKSSLLSQNELGD